MSVFLIAAGGTGGHVLPGLAVAEELRRRGHGAVFAGARRGLESRLAPQAGFELELLRASPLERAGWRQQLRTALHLPAGLLDAGGILERRRPRAVLSLGGYAAGPVLLMSWIDDIPVVAMEPNAWPGLAHRLAGPLVRRALLGFPQAARWFPAGRAEVTGVPIRERFFALEPKAHRPPYTVLITGGSQGSHRLNSAAIESLPRWAAAGRLDSVIFLHQTGQNEYNEICFGYQRAGARAEVTPFLDDMPGAFARADLVVCRAGASAVAELAAAGRAAILVPFPFAADQHQLRNAEAMAAAGGARVVADRELTGERLFEDLRALLDDPARLAAMEQAARRQARPGAARRAAEVLEAL